MTWYTDWFNEDYRCLYQHRNESAAETEVVSLVNRLGLTPDSELLDLCCGGGRHLCCFEKLQWRHLTGLDLSTDLLGHAARQLCHTRLVRADMRWFPFVNAVFSVLCSFFNTLGYFESDEDNHQVLHEIARVLKPNGVFVVEHVNRSSLLDQLVPVSYHSLPIGRVKETRRWNPDTQSVTKTIEITRHDQTRQYQESVQVFAPEQWQQRLQAHGLTVTEFWGDFAGTPLAEQSKRMIMVGHREG